MMRDKQRHILYLSADRGISVWGESGGSAHIRDFVAAAMRSDSKVTLVAARCKEADSSAPSAPVHKIKFRRYAASFHERWQKGDKDAVAKEIRSFFANTVLSRQLPDLAKQNDFSLVYERYSLLSFAGRNFARQQGLPFVLEVNAPLIEEALEHRQLHLKELASSIAKYLFSSADRIVAVSSEVGDYIHSIAPKAHVTVVPNAVSPSRFEEYESLGKDSYDSEKVADSTLALLANKFVVGYLGSLRPWHGLNNLLQSFALMAKGDSNAHLLIIGDGKTVRPELEKKCIELGIDTQVTFAGEVSNSKVPLYLSYCDTLVAPYPASENFYFSPLKVFEYMASGKPIVASDIGQISQLLSDNETALLVAPGDIPELASALKKTRDDSQFAHALGMRANKMARECHSWDVRMKQVNKLFNELESTPRVRQIA